MHIRAELLAAAKYNGISEASLRLMVSRAARFSHPLGNRRYKHFLFMVEGDELKNVWRLSTIANPLAVPSTSGRQYGRACRFCNNERVLIVFDECSKCEGAGCKACDQGLIRRSIKCPDCA